MSKWMRRSFGSSNTIEKHNENYDVNSGDAAQQGHHPSYDFRQHGANHSSPQVGAAMPGGAATATSPYSSSAHSSAAPHMGGYAPPASAGMGMMVDNHDSRAKGHHYSQHSQYHHAGGASVPNKGYDHRPAPTGPDGRSSRSVRSRQSSGGNRDESAERSGARQRSRSNRSVNSDGSSRAGRSSSSRSRRHHQQPTSGDPGSSGHYHYSGSTAAAPPQHHGYHQGPPQAPPPYTDSGDQYKKQSTPVVSASADSQTAASFGTPASGPPAAQSQQSHRRPAYLLHRDLVIGKGSYGQVCIASRGEAEGHTSSSSSGRGSGKRKKFACKCVVLRNDPKYIAKLQEEVNVLRELRGHRNVIRLYDVFCVDNELFIITELGRGGDLFHLLTTHPKHGVTESYAAKTVSEMLSAVAFLHSRSICHRDLKLENWVLESGKDVWSPLKLIDFGLSTHFTPGHRLSRVVGSSYYVAPEVLKKSYTEACDLWSLGVIVYMLLSGAPPFYGKNDEAIKASIVQGEYTFPHELFRDVSDEAMAFVSTLLSYNVEYRYTADQALTHPWLAANLDPESLQRAKDGAKGVGAACFQNDGARSEPMQI